MTPVMDPIRECPEREAFARPTFEALYGIARSYLPDALRLLKVPPDDVDDLLHDIVLIAHRGLDTYRPYQAYQPGQPAGELGQLDTSRVLKPWLSGIAWRLVEKRRGRAYRRLELPHEDFANLPGAPDAAPSCEEVAAEAERRRLIARLLQQIRPERAEVLVLHAFLEMSVPDIARELGLNENTVKSRIARARGDALAATKRLRRDERNMLEGCPLLVPFGIEGWDAAPPAPRPVQQLVGGAMAALTLGVGVGVGIGIGIGAPGDSNDRRADPVAIMAATERLIPAEETPPPATDRVTVVAPRIVVGAPSAAQRPFTKARSTASAGPPPVAGSMLDTVDTVEAEHALLEAARHAIADGEYDVALAKLGAHERRFPRGTLAADREWLKARVHSRRGSDR